jgi:hypothetical protein
MFDSQMSGADAATTLALVSGAHRQVLEHECAIDELQDLRGALPRLAAAPGGWLSGWWCKSELAAHWAAARGSASMILAVSSVSNLCHASMQISPATAASTCFIVDRLAGPLRFGGWTLFVSGLPEQQRQRWFGQDADRFGSADIGWLQVTLQP